MEAVWIPVQCSQSPASKFRVFEPVKIRTVAGPSSAVQWVLRGAPYTVWSHGRRVQVVCPPPCPRLGWCPT